jgi:uncharacterized protein YhaN
MTRATVASNAQEIALLKMAHAHSLDHDREILAAMKDIRDELRAMHETFEKKMEELTDRQNKIETRVDKLLGNVRAFGAGVALPFTLFGAAVAVGIEKILDFIK